MALRVTVVVPTLRASPLLVDCLHSLRAQRTGRERPEIVLVVQEEPGLRATGTESAEELTDRVLRLPRNVGFAAATNRGLATATCPYVATVNDDVVVAEGWLAALVDALEADPEAAAAQGVNLRGRDAGSGEGGSGAAARAQVDGWGLDWNRSLQAVQLGRGASPPTPADPPFRVFGVSATAAVYRREALLRCARPPRRTGRGQPKTAPDSAPEIFDTRLESYYEDAELACRLRAAGYGALSVPAARAFHAGSLTGRSLGTRRWRLLYGNRWAVASTLPGEGFWRRAPRMAWRDAADLGWAMVRGEWGKTWGIVGGWGRALRLLPAFLRERTAP